MNRKSALAAAAMTAVLGATGVVGVLAVTGSHVFGLHFGASRPALANASPTSADTTELTEPVTESPTAVVPTVPTTVPDPIYVVQTEYYDQYVVVPSDGSTPAAPPPAPPPAVQAPASPVTAAPVVTQATAAPAPAVTDPPAPAETPPTAVTTPTTKVTVPADLIDAAKASCGTACKINVPAEAGGFLLPKPAPPTSGGEWKECEFHVGSPPTTTATNHALPGVWECQK
jgi:cytoskeletal protein RodZ